MLDDYDSEHDGPVAAFAALAAEAREKDVPGVDHYFEHVVKTQAGYTLEKLLGALWRLGIGVDRLFSSRVRIASYPAGWPRRGE